MKRNNLIFIAVVAFLLGSPSTTFGQSNEGVHEGFGIGVTTGYATPSGGTLKLLASNGLGFQIEAGVMPIGVQGAKWGADIDAIGDFFINQSSNGGPFWGIGCGFGLTRITVDRLDNTSGLEFNQDVTAVDIHAILEFGYFVSSANIEILVDYKPGLFARPIQKGRFKTIGASLRLFF